MSDRIKKIKIKQSDGTFSDYIPIGADAKNIDTTRGESVQSVIDKTARYYNSIAEMKLDDNIQVGDTCVTLGYYEVNDGGSGTYKIVDDSSLEDDGGSVHELNNGLKAQLMKGIENVLCYGLSPNIEDNSIYINRLNNLNKIIFPSGTYNFKSPITLSNSIIELEDSILNYSGIDSSESFVTFDGINDKKMYVSKGTINANGLCSNVVHFTRTYRFEFNNTILLSGKENGFYASDSNGKLTGIYVRGLANNIGGCGFLLDIADSILINCTNVDHQYGCKCNNGNIRFNNFHSWLSKSENYDDSVCILINTYAPIVIDGLTSDTVKTAIKTLLNYSRVSCLNLVCFNNESVIKASQVVLDLAGGVNNIQISGCFPTTSENPIKIFSDENYINDNGNQYFINGDININIDAPYITNTVTENNSIFLNTLNGSLHIVSENLSSIVNNGLYSYPIATSDNPDSSYGGVCLSIGLNGDRGIQLAVNSNGDSYVRYKNEINNFTQWKKLTND